MRGSHDDAVAIGHFLVLRILVEGTGTRMHGGSQHIAFHAKN